MMFNTAKCNILYLDCGNPKHKHKVGGEWTESSLRKRTLWLLVDEKLNMSWQLAAHKSGQQCKGGILPLHTALVRHHISIQIWMMRQHKKDMDLSEQVQRRAT